MLSRPSCWTCKTTTSADWARGLNPIFLIGDTAVVLDTAAIGALPVQLLRQPVVSLRAQATVISNALDTLFGGF